MSRLRQRTATSTSHGVWVADPASQCAGKHQYPTFGAALRVVKEMRGANAYRCPHCHSFHIGHVAKPPIGRVRRPVMSADGFED